MREPDAVGSCAEKKLGLGKYVQRACDASNLAKKTNKVITTMVMRPLDDPHDANSRFGVRVVRGRALSVSLPWASISSLLIYLHGLALTVFELFGWPQEPFRPSDPDTMTNTALEVIASASGKNFTL